MTPPRTSPLRLDRRRAWLAVAHVATLLACAAMWRFVPGAGTVWPEAAVALLWLAAPSALPRWTARARDAAAIAVLTVGVLLLCGAPALDAVGAAVLVVAAALAGLLLLDRVRPGGPHLEREADTLVLAATAIVTALAMSAAGALIGVLAGSPPAPAQLATEALRSSAFGLGLLAGAAGLFPVAAGRGARVAAPASRLEQAAVWAAGGAAFAGVFATGQHLQVAFLGIPVAVWAALRLSTRGAVLFQLVAGATVIAGTALGLGPIGPMSLAARTPLEVLHVAVVGDSYLLVLSVVVLHVALTRDALHSERARTAQALLRTGEQQALLRGVLDGATQQAIIATGAGSGITLFSSGAERMLGYRAHEVLGGSPLRFYDPLEMAERAAALGVPVGFSGAAVTLHDADEHGHATSRWTAVRKDGSRLRVLLTLSPRHEAGGEVVGYVGVLTDVTAQEEAEERLTRSEELFRTAYEAAPTGLVVISLSPGSEGGVRRVNHSFAAFTGRTEADLVGMRLADLLHEGDVEAHLAHLASAAGGGDPEPDGVERRFTTPGGEVRWGRKTTRLITPDDGRDPYLLAVIEDVTARRAAEEALMRLAMHDPLTGLPNRALLADRLERALTADERLRQGVTVIYGDLDGFKPVNDSHGHAAGDLLLREVAARLERTVRTGDTVARLGGDEFAVLCPSLRAEQVPIVIERIQRALSLPVRLPGGAVVRVGLSTGVACSVGGDDPARLLDEADQAMFVAKRRRKLEAGESVALPAPRAARTFTPVADSHR